MSRQWKPGDVALVEAGCWANRKVALRLDEGWSHVNGVNVDGDGIVSPVRPLVVIDAEDREQVKRLFDAYCTTVNRNCVDAMQAALRSLIAPTKPEEPQGLGAVVEDEGGVPWVRCENADREPHWYARNKMRTYADITAVRVLSEGVTA